jgi:hypothetical protein
MKGCASGDSQNSGQRLRRGLLFYDTPTGSRTPCFCATLRGVEQNVYVPDFVSFFPQNTPPKMFHCIIVVSLNRARFDYEFAWFRHGKPFSMQRCLIARFVQIG